MKKSMKHLNIEQQQRFIELEEERTKHDEVRGIKKSEFNHALLVLNLRITQYVEMFNFSLEKLCLQTLLDFKNEITVIAKSEKFDKKKAVAVHDGKAIYVDQFVTKEDFKNGGVEYFTFNEPYEGNKK